FGFTMGGKKNDGYARWAKKNEIKKQLKQVDPKAYTADAAGLVVINDGKTLWVDDGEAHNIVIGATGSGKTQAVVFPMVQSLAKKGESMIITDPKGEIYETTANMLKERGYNIVLLNFRSPQNGNGWNPMALPYKLYKEGNSDKAIELLDDLALNILYEEKNGNADPFWEKSAADYFTGLALGLFEDAKEEQVNLNSLNLMSSLGEERFGGPNNNYMKEYFNSKDPSRPAYVNASGVVFTAEDTKQGVLATFKQKIKLFSSRDNLSEMLCHSDFEMKEIGRQKTAVFMVVQDEKKTLHPLATIFIKQCYETLIDVAQESGGKLPFRTNFILDEFANMPPLKDVTTMVTAARSRLIRFTFIIQNYAQLTQVYGKENAETIKGNCNITYLISSELGALEELSKLCGEVKSKEKDKTASTPLVTVSDLQRLQQYETISLRLRTWPFKTKLVPNYKMDWGRNYEKATYPVRERRKVELFDIREFVKEMKKKKMADMMGSGEGSGMSGSMPNPMMSNPMFGANPFAMNNPFSSASSSSQSGGFNVDDLVKRIDAKIAELEEEERQEKENKEKNNISNDIIEKTSNQDLIEKRVDTNSSNTNSNMTNINIVTPEVIVDKDKPSNIIDDKQILDNDKHDASGIVNLDEISKESNNLKNNNQENDDNFFDDFFFDE
ncbi:MAG: type IV secretory system conjugative DNA transfer family protein, partial [Bacilli bacterium]|nr:type IV secretory system conjugative DNA transfer family protein [Bacilli bacterium]